MREPLKDPVRLQHILDAIHRVEEFIEGYTEETLNADVHTKYELVDIDIEPCYHITDDACALVCENVYDEIAESQYIERDSQGIPMGQSMPEIKEREIFIKIFLKQWAENNPDRRIYNNALGDYIFIKGISVIEAKEHSAKSYRSTQAILLLDEILREALPVRRIQIKKGNKNQAAFAYMLVMVYRHTEIGTIKVTVGVKSNEQHIEYGISALQPGKPLIDDNKSGDTHNKRKRRPR